MMLGTSGFGASVVSPSRQTDPRCICFSVIWRLSVAVADAKRSIRHCKLTKVHGGSRVPRGRTL